MRRGCRDGDIAMYQAKAAGRSGFATFDRRARAATVARVALEAELRHALAGGGLVPHYQPMVDLRGRDVCSVEALARWDHPRRGLVSPAEFIPVAEETGLITELGRLVLASACADAVRWSAAGRPVVVHVNLSLGQLTGRLVDQVAATLAATGLPAAQLGLEITESMVMADPEQAQAVVRELRDLGVTTALDDFGTGYSSLARLQELPVTTLKLDRTFTARLPSPAGTSVAAAIIDLAHALGVTVVAEGVETAEQLEVLRELGCDGAQGFHLAMPMPAEDLDAWLRSAPRLVR